MAWSKADVPAADRANLAADMPCALGTNVARDATTPKWTIDGNQASSDQSATGYAATLCRDDQDHAITKPGSSQTAWYLNLDWSPAAGDIQELILKNHNLSGHLVELQIADNAAFSTRLATVYSATPATNKRIVALSLKEGGDTYAQRFSGVLYARLKITGSSFIPQIGELVLSRRRQLPSSLQLPLDKNQRRVTRTRFVSYSQVITDYVWAKGQRGLKGILHTATASVITDLDALWMTDTSEGTLPWWWIWLPNSAPSDALWMVWDTDEFISPSSFSTDREYNLAGLEKGNNFLAINSGV